MSEIQLVAKVNPFDSLVTFVNRLAKPTSGEWHKAADAVTQGMAESFGREGNAEGKWPQLSFTTVYRRRRMGYPGEHPILVQAGDLKRSWLVRGAADHVEEFRATATGWTLTVGSESDIAQQHEAGWGRVPDRPVLPFSDAAEVRIGDVLDYLVGQIQAQTLGR